MRRGSLIGIFSNWRKLRAQRRREVERAVRCVAEMLEERVMLAGPIDPTNVFFQGVLGVPSLSEIATASPLRDVIEEDYVLGNKHYLYLGAGVFDLLDLTVFIDLDDYFDVSSEGKNDSWVTVYAQVELSDGVGLPFKIGYWRRPGVQFGLEDGSNPNAADPYLPLGSFVGLKFTVGAEFIVAGIDQGEVTGPKIETEKLGLDLSVSSGEAEFPIGPVEVQKELVDSWFDQMLFPGVVIPGDQMASLVAKNIYDCLLAPGQAHPLVRFPATPTDGWPIPIPPEPNLQPSEVDYGRPMPLLTDSASQMTLGVRNAGAVDATGRL